MSDYNERDPDVLYFDNEQFETEIDLLLPLIKHVNEQTEHPQGQDRKISAFMEAIADKIYDPEQYVFRYLLIENLMDPRAPGFSEYNHATMKLLKAVQKPLLAHRDEWDFPDGFDDPAVWSKAIDWILSDEMMSSDFAYDLFMRRNQANIDRRYKSVPAITGIYRDYEGRFQDPLMVLDMGSSIGAGSDKLEAGSPFEPPTVVRETASGLLVVDRTRTSYIGSLVTNYEVEQSTRVDIANFSDPGARPWVASSSGYPSEHQNRDLYSDVVDKAEYNEDGREISNVIPADVLSLESMLEAGLEPESYDVAIISSAHYEFPGGQRHKAWSNALRFLKPDGIVIVNEFAYVDAAGHFRIHANFFDKLYKYSATVLDKANLDKGKQPFFLYDNGRASSLKLQAGALALMRRRRRLAA